MTLNMRKFSFVIGQLSSIVNLEKSVILRFLPFFNILLLGTFVGKGDSRCRLIYTSLGS